MEGDLPFEVVEEEHLGIADGVKNLGDCSAKFEDSKGVRRPPTDRALTGAKVNSSLEGTKPSGRSAALLFPGALSLPHKYILPDRESRFQPGEMMRSTTLGLQLKRVAFAGTSHSGTALWKITKSAQRFVDA